jgi:YD repeat-containing protein
MQFSMMTGWVYSVVRMVRGEAESHTKWHANRGVACDLDCAEMDSQTLAPACRSSQNTVKMPVGIGVFISPRKAALALFLSLSAITHACIFNGGTTPCPQDCIEHGGEAVCIKPVPTPDLGLSGLQRDAESWRYSNTDCSYGGVDAIYHVDWCLSIGGTPGSSCTNSNCPACFHSAGGVHPLYWASYYAEGVVAPNATAYANQGAQCGPATQISDSGWGAASSGCSLTGGTKSIGGVETLSTRKFEFTVPYKTSGICQGATRNIKISGLKTRDATCPAGYAWREIGTTATDLKRNVVCVKSEQETCASQCGNPILMSTAAKIQNETDYVSATTPMLSLQRTYNSRGFYSPDAASNSLLRNFGRFWRSNFDRRVHEVNANIALSAVAERHDGVIKRFDANGDEIEHFGTAREKLIRIADGWRYITANDNVEIYNSSGRLLSISNRSGQKVTLTYSTTPTSEAPFAGLLVAVADDFGRTLTMKYDATGLVSSVTDPAGQIYVYAYNAEFNLETVSHPGGNLRRYTYARDALEKINATDTLLPNMLTGIVDENNSRFATFK